MKTSDTLFNPLVTASSAQAAQWVQAGYLLAYPTESVWGIGCDPFDQAAVQQLLTIKSRSVDKGMIVVTDSVARIAPLLASLNPKQRQNIVNSWQLPTNGDAQQAHTWLLPLPEQLEVPIPSWITGVHNSVAVRVIAHPLIKQLCAQIVSVDNPYGCLVSTSCNPSGQRPALTLSQAQDYFVNSGFAREVVYLQGDTLGYQLPSQINDALTGHIIR